METLENYSKVLQSALQDAIKDILQDIAVKHNLSFEDLCTTYIDGKSVPPPPIANVKDDAPKKRGRKKKQKEEMIETEEIVYEGKTYLVDDKNTVYTNAPNAPVVVGERLVNNNIKFY